MIDQPKTTAMPPRAISWVTGRSRRKRVERSDFREEPLFWQPALKH